MGVVVKRVFVVKDFCVLSRTRLPRSVNTSHCPPGVENVLGNDIGPFYQMKAPLRTCISLLRDRTSTFVEGERVLCRRLVKRFRACGVIYVRGSCKPVPFLLLVKINRRMCKELLLLFLDEVADNALTCGFAFEFEAERELSASKTNSQTSTYSIEDQLSL